jgi:hypothetical protein
MLCVRAEARTFQSRLRLTHYSPLRIFNEEQVRRDRPPGSQNGCLRGVISGLPSRKTPDLVTAVFTVSPAAAAPFPGAVAVLAVNGPVTTRLKRHGGLLSASGACDGGGL